MRLFPNLIGFSVCFEMGDESYARVLLEDITDLYEMACESLGSLATDITLEDALELMHEAVEAWELDDHITWWVRAHKMLPVVRIN